jgi:type IV pilus assembly protein PilX
MKRSPVFQRGMALMSSMLLLLVTTVLAIAMFRSFGLSERIAGNTREKQRALHSAESAQTAAEWWLTANSGANVGLGTSCASGLVMQLSTAPTTAPQICTNALASATTLPWSTYVSYTPTGMSTGTTGFGIVGNYISPPAFYIQYLNFSYASTISNYTYLIDAAGAGGNVNSAAVVEGIYNVSVTTTQLPMGADGMGRKFLNLGGP